MLSKNKVITGMVIGCCFFSSAFACPARSYKGQVVVSRPWWYHPVVTFSAGQVITKIGKSQTLSMDGDFTQYRYTNQTNQVNHMIWGGLLGTEVSLSPATSLILGLGYYQPSTFSAHGILTQGVDVPSSDQYTYRYHLRSQQFLLEGKLLFNMQKKIHPYLLFGAGMAFNTAYAYTTSAPPFLTFTPQFTNHTNASYTYALGAGVDMDIKKNWRLGIGYRFTDLGEANLGHGLVDTTPFTAVISQPHWYVQEGLVQLTYRIL